MIGSSGGMLFAPGRRTPVTAVLRDAGFTRPPAQEAQGATDSAVQVIPLSAEVLAEHDADTVLVPQGAYYDAAAVRAVPTFAQLPAVVQGRSLQVDGDMWFGNFAFAVDWIVTDLQALVAGAGQAGMGTPDQALARWAAFDETVAPADDGPAG
ncbi:hypothetical protein BJF78_04310 [Pseudonocardia sp. CNS-139]|nr:hypothetical protein BJF78_04310 [Pseudonocardia sp. CNS-139]